jgi:D-alanine-D-alanine ligase
MFYLNLSQKILMSILQTLAPQQIATLKMLYLARFAPEPGVGDERPSFHPIGGVFAQYHHELYKLIQSLGINVTPSHEVADLLATASNYNYVFTVYNRSTRPVRNFEVFISSVCEYLHLPYLGAPPNIRASAEDKLLTKMLAQSLQIPTPLGKAYSQVAALYPPDFPPPYFIKPRFGAASEGISEHSYQTTWAGAKQQIEQLITQDHKECLLEQAIAGTDITVPVLGGTVPIILPGMEEISETAFGVAVREHKLLQAKGRERVALPESNLNAEITNYINRLLNIITPFDYLRVDFRLSEDRRQVFLTEINIACNLASYAAVSQSAQLLDITQHQLLQHIISHSLARQQSRLI